MLKKNLSYENAQVNIQFNLQLNQVCKANQKKIKKI